MKQALLEAFTGQFQQLRRRPQIHLCPNDVLVTEISRQQWQLGMDINAFLRPGHEPMDGKGAAELVGAYAASSAGRLKPELPQYSADRL
jgi:hypothetical protein